MAKHLDKLSGLTFAQAEEIMSSDEHSQLVVESKSHHIALSPKYLCDVKGGVTEQLDRLLTHYDKSMGGVPLAYKNVKACQRLGKIIADQPCIHFDVIADFVLFKPSVGCTLKGAVHSVDKKYAACLVHRCFSAWFLQPQSQQGVKFQPDKSLLGQEVEFRVDEIFTGSSVLSIHGTLLKKLPQTNSREDLIESLTSKAGSAAENVMSKNGLLVSDSKTSDQKKSKANVGSVGNDSAISVDINDADAGVCDDGVNSSSKKKKKKKKKQRDVESSDVIEEVKDMGKELSGNVGKAAEENVSGEAVIENNAGESSKKKKKRKSDKKKDSVGVDAESNVLSSEASSASRTGVDVNLNVVTNEDGNVSKHKKKRKRKHSESLDKDSVTVNPEESVETKQLESVSVGNVVNGDVDHHQSKKLKKHKRKREELQVDTPISDDDFVSKKKKKKLN